jgi:hypothetical protein
VEGNFRWLELEINNLSREPDQQRRQRVYQHQGVQQGLVLVQINRNSET